MSKGIVTIDEETKTVLRAATINGHKLTLNSGVLDRTLYVKVNAALEYLGGKWSRGDKAHVFPGDPAEALASTLDAGQFVDKRKAYAYFPTPSDVAYKLVMDATITPDDRILEPSAGDGAIVREIRRCGYHNHITAVEIDRTHRERLRDARPNRIVWGDFLKADGIEGNITRIIANPPFGNGTDVRHVLRMWNILAPGGKLVSIMASSVLYRTTGAYTDLMSTLPGERDRNVIKLPDASFKGSGTGVGTCILILKKQK